MEISLEKYEAMQDRIAELETANKMRLKQVEYLTDTVVKRDKEIDHLRAKQPHWISVKDRLPEELTPVNVVWVSHNPQPYYSKIKDVPQSNATAVYFCGRWYWWDATIKESEITHWMPLPEPPEVEDGRK